MKRTLAAVFGICLGAMTAGCVNADRKNTEQLRKHKKSDLIQTVRILLSGETGNNSVTGVYEIRNMPPASDEAGNQWVMVVQGMAGHYLTYHNIAAATEYTLKTDDPSTPSYAGTRRCLPTRQAWKQWYADVCQDSLLRLKARGYTARVEFLNAHGQTLDTFTTGNASPVPALQPARTPGDYFEKSRDIIHAKTPWPG